MKRIAIVLLILSCCVPLGAKADVAVIQERLDAVVRAEMKQWGISGVAVALLDDQEVIYANGFGEAERSSVFRVGSISKLFNALAVMQQVEAGRLDLDRPLAANLLPLNAFAEPLEITLRQILCHRSGLQREGAVGGYLDPSEPGLAATVASVRQGVIVTKPGAEMRYSNLAPSIAGWVVSQVTGQRYPDYQAARLLKPLGMNDSAWLMADVPSDRLIKSNMRVADGKGGWERRQTPEFDLGTVPAGNLFSTVDDLARFGAALLDGGRGLVSRKSLEEMWRPQLTDEDRGFGLGFAIGRVRNHRSVSHSGAVYGHSSSIVLLPDVKVGVIVLANEDIANGRVRRMSRTALDLMLQRRRGEAATAPPKLYKGVLPLTLTGDYESESYWARLSLRDGRLVGDLSGQPTQFRRVGEWEFLADNRITDAGKVRFIRKGNGAVTGFTMGSQTYQRVPEQAPALPEVWHDYLGHYGVDFIPIIITERFGHLYAMTENMVDYRLTPVNRHVWALPKGMYVKEEVVFITDAEGQATRINFANMVFERIR